MRQDLKIPRSTLSVESRIVRGNRHESCKCQARCHATFESLQYSAWRAIAFKRRCVERQKSVVIETILSKTRGSPLLVFDYIICTYMLSIKSNRHVTLKMSPSSDSTSLVFKWSQGNVGACRLHSSSEFSTRVQRCKTVNHVSRVFIGCLQLRHQSSNC